MSEQLSPQHERHEHLENEPKVEAQEHKTEKISEQHSEHEHHNVEAIKHSIEAEAKTAAETRRDGTPTKAPQHHLISKDLRIEALHRSLQRVRKHLSPANKVLSKAVHAPTIDTLSKVGEKTIARPTGLLTGAIVSLAGTSYLLYSAKHFGYTYNYFVIFILFGGGYLVGLVIELLIFTLRHLRHSR